MIEIRNFLPFGTKHKSEQKQQPLSPLIHPTMNNDNNEQHSDDDSSLNRRRIRRGPNRGRSTMPEPDNVLPSVTASAPTFRYVQTLGDSRSLGPLLLDSLLTHCTQ